METFKQNFLFTVCIIVVSFTCIKCSSKKTLTPLTQVISLKKTIPTEVNVNFCTQNVSPESYFKMLIILDFSASNINNWVYQTDGQFYSGCNKISNLPVVTPVDPAQPAATKIANALIQNPSPISFTTCKPNILQKIYTPAEAATYANCPYCSTGPINTGPNPIDITLFTDTNSCGLALFGKLATDCCLTFRTGEDPTNGLTADQYSNPSNCLTNLNNNAPFTQGAGLIGFLYNLINKRKTNQITETDFNNRQFQILRFGTTAPLLEPSLSKFLPADQFLCGLLSARKNWLQVNENPPPPQCPAQGIRPEFQQLTDYTNALEQAKTIIDTDIQANLNSSKTISYAIIFISDGSPVIKPWIEPSRNLYRISDATSLSKVADIISLSDRPEYSQLVSGINFYTVYYYWQSADGQYSNQDPLAQSLLSQMAKQGKGFFINASSNESLNYDRFNPPTLSNSPALSNILVTNSAVNYWDDGKLYADQDLDGLPDLFADSFGYNSSLNPIDKKISPMVDYYLRSINSKNKLKDFNTFSVTQWAESAFANSPNAQTCNSSSPGSWPKGKVGTSSPVNSCDQLRYGLYYPDSDCDGLTDYEATLSGSPCIPTLRGDLPDGLRMQKLIYEANPTTSTDRTKSGSDFSKFEKVQLSLPTRATVSNIQPAQYSYTITSQDASQTCSILTVTNLPRLADTQDAMMDSKKADIATRSDQIRVDLFLQAQSGLSGQKQVQYYTLTTPLAPNQTKIDIKDWNDPDWKSQWHSTTLIQAGN